MSFDDFINKWNSKGIDFDGVYGDQCMDLMHQYVVEVLGLSDGRILAAPSAKDVYQNFPAVFGSQYFDKIDNTPEGVPQKGDIVFWGQGVGQYGHVAIFESGDVNDFKSFDQNWPLNSNCHTQDHNYNGVLGWLRLKTAPTPTPQPDPCVITDQTKIPQIDNMEVQAIGSERKDNIAKVVVLNTQVSNLQDIITKVKALVS